MTMLFSEHLKQLMDEKNIGVNELATHSGVSSSYISRIINGKRSTPSPKTIQKLSIALGVEYETLMSLAGYIGVNNNTPFPPSEPKKPKDLKKILEQHEIMFDGVPVDEEAKADILHIVEFELYKRAKEMNKRKKAKDGANND